MERYKIPSGGIEVIISEGQPTLKSEEAELPATPIERIHTPQIRRRKPLNYLVSRAFVLVGAFALIGNIPVYSKISTLADENDFLIDGQEINQQLESANNDLLELVLPANPVTYAGHEQEILPDASSGKWTLHQISRGENIEDILTHFQLKTSAEDLLADDNVKHQLAQLKDDHKILIQVENKQVEQLIYATGKRKAYIVSRQDGSYVGKWGNSLYEEQHNRIAFTINRPFHEAAAGAGVPSSITGQLAKIFRKDVDFRRIQLGDQVSVIFEDYYYQSDRIYTDKILAAEFHHNDNTYQRIRFASGGDDKAMYLNPDSDVELKEVAFNRYPLKGGRLSSSFGMRRHPVLRRTRMHSGTDFAAPRGTPIYATSAGKVAFVGRKGAYGKLIELRHEGGIVTRYGHMSKYQKSLNVGDTVKRGDIIGYVGSTGRSTGNHVHYEFLVDGKPQNPMKVKLPMKGILTAKEMNEFKRLSKNMSYQLIKLRDTASIERNVRRQFGG